MNCGGCRRWNAGFEAFSDLFGWMRFFGVLRSHKKCRILKRANTGVRQRCAKSDERRQNFSEKCTHKFFSTMFNMFLGIFRFKPLQRTLRKKFSSTLSCCFMLRERCAGPQIIISRLEFKSLLACVRKCVLVLCAKPAIYHDLQRRYTL